MHTNTRIRFLSGQDQPGSLVDFTYLLGPWLGPALPLEVSLNRGTDINGFLPGNFRALRTPQLAADPNNADTLYLVYHDTATADPDDKDVNIYLQKLTRVSGSLWSPAGAREGEQRCDAAWRRQRSVPAVGDRGRPGPHPRHLL